MARKKPKPKIDAYAETVRWFREKVPIRKTDWLELDRKARERSFTVAHIAKLDLLNDALKAITKALRDGETLEAFKKRIGSRLEKAWGEERAWHLEVIFRNNVQAAYAHGREMEQRSPEALEERPFWMLDVTLDDRTTREICLPLRGTVLPATHKFWHTHTPPLHHNCRTIKRALTPEQAKRRGIDARAPKVESQDGFGGADPLQWEPDLSKYPANLARLFKRKQR